MHDEQPVIDEIDRLVDESLSHGPTDDYDASYGETCRLCHGEWHGKPNFSGCPGAFATEQQQRSWREKLDTVVRLVGMVEESVGPVAEDNVVLLAGMVFGVIGEVSDGEIEILLPTDDAGLSSLSSRVERYDLNFSCNMDAAHFEVNPEVLQGFTGPDIDPDTP
jgi:hypothetical protein